MAAPVVTTRPLLLSSWVCPYVNRVLLALSFKGVRKEVEEVGIDLANKPDWFKSVSPFGKVPVVTYRRSEGAAPEVLYESLVLVDWVNDYFAGQGPALLPQDPAERARARIIAGRFDSTAIPAFYRLLRSATREDAHAEAATLTKEFEWLEGQLAASSGPFLVGDAPSIADIAVIPWLLRLHLLQHYRGARLLEHHPRVAAYAAHVSALPEVSSTAVAPEGAGDFASAIVKAYTGYGKEPVDYFASSAA